MTFNITRLSAANHLAHTQYRPDIDGLRAIAVLSVVIYHAFPKFIRGGFIGVDIFFVISGFLISTIIISSLERGSFSFVVFYSRRIKRIFPALIIVLMASIVLGWFTMLAGEYKQLGKHISGGSGFISNFLFWHESGYFDDAAETKPLLHLWSLGIEEQFYIIWPFILWFVWKKRFNLLLITIVIALISFALNISKVYVDSVAAFYSPQTRFWELSVGSILAYLTLHKQQISVHLNQINGRFFGSFFNDLASIDNLRSYQALVGVFLILTSLFVVTKASYFPGWWAMLPTIGSFLIISAGMTAWFNRVVLSSRILVWIGLISFPLYLWHWPLLSFAHILETETPSRLVRFDAILLAILLAWLTYTFIEKPIRFGNAPKYKTLSLMFIMACIGLAGYYIYANDGLKFRSKVSSTSPLITELSTIQNAWQFFDINNAYRVGTCHMASLKDKLQVMQNCIDKNRPLVFIWGDSYAASLYPGILKLKATNKDAFGIAQFTNGNAPPFFDANKETDDIENIHQNLLEVNNKKLEIIAEIKPSLVILAWMYNGSNGLNMADSVLAIKSTIKKINIVSENTKVIVIGSFPEWGKNLKNVIIKYANNNNDHLPSIYSSYGLLDEPKKWDLYFKNKFKGVGVNYISTQDFLCNSEGCLTRTGESAQDLTAVDSGHLTPSGSEFIINKIGNKILDELQPK